MGLRNFFSSISSIPQIINGRPLTQMPSHNDHILEEMIFMEAICDYDDPLWGFQWETSSPTHVIISYSCPVRLSILRICWQLISYEDLPF